MSIQGRPRGVLASKEGAKLLESKKNELNLSYSQIANAADLGSEDQVKRLFHPQWQRKVQRDTVYKIAKVLSLDPMSIIETEEEESERIEASCRNQPASVVIQKIWSDIEADGDLEAQDVVQKAPRGSSVEQTLVTHLKVTGNIKFGNLTQES